MLIAGAALVGVTAVGVDATARGALDGFLLAGAVFVAIGAFEAVNPLPDAAQRLNVCAGAAQRLEEITERPAPVADPRGAAARARARRARRRRPHRPLPRPRGSRRCATSACA